MPSPGTYPKSAIPPSRSDSAAATSNRVPTVAVVPSTEEHLGPVMTVAVILQKTAPARNQTTLVVGNRMFIVIITVVGNSVSLFRLEGEISFQETCSVR